MEARKRDINLQLVAGRAAGRTHLAVFPDRPGLTTTDPSIVERHEADGFRSETITTQMVPLEDILAAHCHEPIDFMKIDVEGAEADVLASFDLCRLGRPERSLSKPLSQDLTTHRTTNGNRPSLRRVTD